MNWFEHRDRGGDRIHVRGSEYPGGHHSRPDDGYVPGPHGTNLNVPVVTGVPVDQPLVRSPWSNVPTRPAKTYRPAR